MIENLDNNDWKKDAPTLAVLDRQNAFSVPENYFEDVNEHIHSAIFLDRLKQESQVNSFEVPENYFNELTERIENSVKLAAFPKETPFIVPDQYFETLQDRISAKIANENPEKTAKVIPLWRRSFVKYASAACFVLMASFGIYFYPNGSSNIPVAQTQAADLANEQLLYDIDESTIIEHLEAQNTPSSNSNSVSGTEMENYILNSYSPSDLSHELNN